MADFYYNDLDRRFSGNQYDFKKKNLCVKNYITYMLNRTATMFDYDNLPKSIDKRILELFLQTAGQVGFYKYKDELYFFVGSGSGLPDQYFRPSKYVIVNPYLDLSKTVDIYYGDNEIKEDMCVVMRNDTMSMGLVPLCRKYASLLTENDLSLKIASINARAMSVFVAGDDDTAISAKEFQRQLEAGNMAAITSSFMSENENIVQNVSAAASNTITNLIELEQYIKASWFNELGLNANYNMKRESINSEESQLNFDALLPLVDDMLDQRARAVELINEYFGTNIEVHLHGAWRMLQEEHLQSDNIDDFLNSEDNNETIIEKESDKASEEIIEEEAPENEEHEPEEEGKPQEEITEEQQEEIVETSTIEEKVEEVAEVIAEKVLDEIIETVEDDNTQEDEDDEEETEEDDEEEKEEVKE